jgi:hypothetical protein
VKITPFTVNIVDPALADLKHRRRLTRWPDEALKNKNADLGEVF